MGKALRRALGFLRPHLRDMSGAAFSMLLVSAANLMAPQLIRYAIDSGIIRRQAMAVFVAVGGLTLVAVGRGVFTFLQEFLTERASQGVAFELRDALYAQTQRLSFSYFDRAGTSQLLTRHTNDVELVRAFTGAGIMQLLAAVIMLTGSTLLLFRLNWRLTLIALATVPAVFLLLIRFVRRIGPLYRQMQGMLEHLNSLLQESLAGMRVVRAFGREDFEAGRYSTANDALVAQNLYVMRLMSNSIPMTFFFVNLGVLAVIWYGGLQVIGGRMTVGELIAFNSYLGFLIMPILTLGMLTATITQAGISASRIFEVLDADIEVRDAPDAQTLPLIAGRVEFREVHFRYPGSEQEVLHSINLSVEPGQLVAILGPTGSGKSTLLNLLPRFYDVTAGGVLVDGRDVREVTLESLRRQIAVVLQETLLFSGSVRENIAYGRPDATSEEIERAALDARADEFIRALPEGYDTHIGARGVGLSGGQRQRIAIARALLVNPRLLILDDSTSAVDAVTEAAILESLDRLMRDRRRTTFVIAHRISTVRDANAIVLIDQGQIVAQGTHEELLRTSPLYHELLTSQLSPAVEPSMPANAQTPASAQGRQPGGEL
ncbi:MAG: ABC transporter ATP-binding protein [Pyrinomonadaceae bacterium]